MQRDFIGYVLDSGLGHDKVWLGATGSLLVVAPELVKTVLITRVDSFRKSLVTRLVTRDYVQGGVILATGEEHARQRRLLQPALSALAVKLRSEDILGRARAEVATWESGSVVDIDTSMANLALSVVSNALFGVSTADKGDLVEAVRSFELTLRERLEGIPWTGWDPGLGRDRLQHSVRRAHHELTLNIAARRERGDPGADLLGHLLTAMEGDHPLEEAELLDHCVTLFFAGHGTTSRALAWTLAVLARHPDWWDRAAAEASGKSAPEAGSDSPFPLLDRILLESMRLYPPAWLLDREVIEPVRLGDDEIPVGTTVLCCAIVTQRDPRYWSDPERFDPDRWLPGGEATRVHRLAYYPFSAGVRTCPGRAFALLEARLILAEVLRTVRLSHEPVDRPLRLRTGVTMSCWGGMPMRVERLD